MVDVGGGAVNDDFPEDVIHHIQSYLNGKDAAKTTILSKTWYESWKNRPDLDFDERHFQLADGFLNFATSSIGRYQDLKLKVDKFHLWMNVVHDFGSAYVAAYLISKSVKMGVNDVNVEIQSPLHMFLLPMSVFETTSLVRLSISGCIVGRTLGEEILCCGLMGFRLCDVRIDDDMMAEITTSCPLLKNVFLSDCEGFSRVNMSKLLHLEKVHIRMAHSRSRALGMSPLIEFHERTIGFNLGDISSLPVFERLSSLLLEGVKLDPGFFVWFSAVFPCLMDLTIRDCQGYERFSMSSKSLKLINFQPDRSLKSATFDVPGIKMFKYSGVLIHSLCIRNGSNEWESDITLTCRLKRASLFRQLKKFLSSLSPSKISLVMHVTGYMHPELFKDVQGLGEPNFKPEVGNFKLMELPYHTEACSALWYGLLWCFSPKIVYHVQLHNSLDVCAISNHEDFWKAFAERLVLNGTRTAQALSCIHGLEGVNLEIFEETRSEWQPLLWKTFLDASTVPKSGRKVRFQLKWKGPCENGGAN